MPDIALAMSEGEAAEDKIAQPTFTAADSERPGVRLGWAPILTATPWG